MLNFFKKLSAILALTLITSNMFASLSHAEFSKEPDIEFINIIADDGSDTIIKKG